MTATHRGDPATTSGTPVAEHPARISEAPVDDSLPHCCERWLAEQAHHWAVRRPRSA